MHMSMTGVQGTRGMCSTGQGGSTTAKEAKGTERKEGITGYTTREERRETQREPNYQKERSEHLPDPIRGV